MRLASLALIALVAVAMALGVLTVGGPEQARAERRDQQRMNDLHDLAHHVACLQAQGLEPNARSDACPAAARRPDPLTGEPYRVEAASAGFVRVCAEFETPVLRHWWASRTDFDPDTGCLVVTTGSADRL